MTQALERTPIDDSDVLLAEYNNLWSEKLIHKNSIRKFHNYLTYLTGASSLALTFLGVSATDLFQASVDPKTFGQTVSHLRDTIFLLSVPFAPVVFATLTFPLNDMFHVYAIGRRIAQIERKLNRLRGDRRLLVWESRVCPTVYGGQPFSVGARRQESLTNVISRGDILLLFPLLAVVLFAAVGTAFVYLLKHTPVVVVVAYVFIVLYMFFALAWLGAKVFRYTSPTGPLAQAMEVLDPLDEPAAPPLTNVSAVDLVMPTDTQPQKI
jgi:hypothetical protein